MAKPRNRIPVIHIKKVRTIVSNLGGEAPRFAIASELKRMEPHLSMETCLEYVLGAVKDGVLVRVGMNYRDAGG